jgi:LuxR family maltose regulon positive regulatory protein
MDTSTLIQNQLLATKFYVPTALGPLISRPRLTVLLDRILKYPFTLISAPAGFGKTTLLSVWVQSLTLGTPLAAWLSLDQEDNKLWLFWANVLATLDRQQPGLFLPLLNDLQSSQAPSPKSILKALINLLSERKEQFLLILDDYHVISEQEVHTTLSYLVEHLPTQLRIVLATRTDPPLQLPQLRARQQMQEIRTNQLRCTVEETAAFFHQVMGLDLPEKTVQEVTVRTEGWLVSLQLLHLSLPEHADPLSLLEEVSGNQHYILDYLTEEVLQRQPQEVQTFLLCTSILEQLSASLCDVVMEQHGSHRMLQQLEQANLFVVSLDSRRQWYRYHALFAEFLRQRLEQTHADLVPTLHYRASLWYAKHDHTTQAIVHALRAKEWQWAADLIEQKRLQVMTYTWGASEHELILLQQWLEQLPLDIMGSRPQLCFTCFRLLVLVAPVALLKTWLEAVKAAVTASLSQQAQEDVLHSTPNPKFLQEQQNILGTAIAGLAFIQSIDEHGEAALPLCEQALSLLSADNYSARINLAWAQLYAYYYAVNNAEAALLSGLQAVSLAQKSGHSGIVITAMCVAARHLKEAGQLHEAQRLIHQAILLGTKPGRLLIPEAGHPALWQAEILREWNQLEMAYTLIEEALPLCKQSNTSPGLIYIFLGYTVLLRICLSCGKLERAHAALQEFERIGKSLNQPSYLYLHSFYATVDQIRLWLASGELDRATRWAQELDLGQRRGSPFARERQEVACARVHLATNQPVLALQRLEPVFTRATAGKRWGNAIEILLLQALAHDMQQEETQALDALSQAVRLAEPEGYIRSFLDEGAPMENLLSRLRKRERRHGPTPYLDKLLTAFEQECQTQRAAGMPAKVSHLPAPLSKREREVLQLLAQGSSNQQIAQELVITLDTVKRHISHIFSKFGVRNRLQAVKKAKELSLLDDEI